MIRIMVCVVYSNSVLIHLSHSSTKTNTKVSVVMPVFNADQHLDRAIESVLKQTFTEFEVIAIDDGSTDESLAQLRTWAVQDARIRIISHSSNSGIAASRNTGINAANTDYVAFLDADDTWHNDKLTIQYQHHQANRCGFSCTAFWFGRKLINAKKLITYYDLLANNVVNTSSVMVDTRMIDLQFAITNPSEDYQHWLQVAHNHTIHFIKTPLVTRTVFDGVSKNKITMAKRRWRIYRHIEQLPFFTSLKFFTVYAVTGITKYWRAQ